MPGLRSPGMGERAYVYAKACGIIGKSFVGKRMPKLADATRLSELDRMVFPTASRDLPEKELLVDLEDRIIGRAVDSIIALVECFSKPPELLILLIRSYEYTDLKIALDASLGGERTAPAHTDIGRFQTVHFDKYPDIRGMIEGTEFEFLLDKSGALYRELGGISLQTILDRHYYNALWKSLSLLPKRDKYAAEKILSDEISLRNASWALRLRTYYWMTPDEVKLHLIYASSKGGEDMPVNSGEPVLKKASADVKAGKHFSHYIKAPGGKKFYLYKSKTRSLADEAIQSLEFPLDSSTAWASWRWRDFLNPDSANQSLAGGGFWSVDPRYFQNAASRYLYDLARHYFRLHPFTLDTIFCFIKLKLFEEDILTSDAEGLGMGMSSQDVFSLLGVKL